MIGTLDCNTAGDRDGGITQIATEIPITNSLDSHPVLKSNALVRIIELDSVEYLAGNQADCS